MRAGGLSWIASSPGAKSKASGDKAWRGGALSGARGLLDMDARHPTVRNRILKSEPQVMVRGVDA